MQVTAHDRYLRELFATADALRMRLQELRGVRVLVTGASGVVGFAVARVLQHAGANLVLHSRSEHRQAMAELPAPARWLHGDLRNTDDVGQFDLVFHCATYAQPQRFAAEWTQTINLNVQMLFALLEHGKKLGFASTTEIYSGLEVPATEAMVGTTTPQHPRSGYIEAKRLGESICFHSGKAVASRIALAAGPYPRIDDSRALYQIIRRARTEGVVRLRGGRSNVRQYQYSFACALRFIVTTVWGTQGVYNNAGPYVMSMEQLGLKIARHLRTEFDPGAEDPGIVGAPSIVSVDVSRTQQEFPCLSGVDPPLDSFIESIVDTTSHE